MGPTGAGPGRAVLPGPVRGWLGAVAGLAAVAVALLGARYGGAGGPGRADVRVRGLLGDAGASWRRLAEGADFLGEPVGAAGLVAAGVLGCLVARRPRAAVLLLGGVGASVAATTLLKPVVGRTIHGGYLAFPSGHTAFLTAFALVVALVVSGRLGLGRTAGLSLVLAAGAVGGALMGWAQIVLDAHYPTDVLGGWCTALAVVPAVAWMVDRLADSPAHTRN
ncbi:phosphatase PAP2 family protein [Streptomyces sp. R302]|uniref:phosphatase PAP2 family protein n=1 Tax=unclassified Streptomyces TaxID=2593676 RepID=UPI00145F9CA6|nr:MULTISPECIES: phosphatase PAP2 family protein [unclassified Streptomyces]NML52609.1 phosphatase PAP2 family protein [Streptomyces sp. R301]NML80462.1 phosphatase PAP2 family protein [Streptomyces sp. R302]